MRQIHRTTHRKPNPNAKPKPKSNPSQKQIKANATLNCHYRRRQGSFSAKGFLCKNRNENTPNENVTAFSPKISDDCLCFLTHLQVGQVLAASWVWVAGWFPPTFLPHLLHHARQSVLHTRCQLLRKLVGHWPRM